MKVYKKIILNSIIAGFLIGLGCIINLSCADKIIGAFLFSLGLLTVIVQKRCLYTGKIGYLNFCHGVWEKDSILLLVCLVFNLLSIGVFTYCMKNFGGLPVDPTSICDAKTGETMLQALFKSIGCGMLMYIAVEGYAKTNNALIVVMSIMMFILAGFDHCVANYGYLAMNGIWFCPQLIVWIIGNSIGSFIISKIY